MFVSLVELDAEKSNLVRPKILEIYLRSNDTTAIVDVEPYNLNVISTNKETLLLSFDFVA